MPGKRMTRKFNMTLDQFEKQRQQEQESVEHKQAQTAEDKDILRNAEVGKRVEPERAPTSYAMDSCESVATSPKAALEQDNIGPDIDERTDVFKSRLIEEEESSGLTESPLGSSQTSETDEFESPSSEDETDADDVPDPDSAFQSILENTPGLTGEEPQDARNRNQVFWTRQRSQSVPSLRYGVPWAQTGTDEQKGSQGPGELVARDDDIEEARVDKEKDAQLSLDQDNVHQGNAPEAGTPPDATQVGSQQEVHAAVLPFSYIPNVDTQWTRHIFKLLPIRGSDPHQIFYEKRTETVHGYKGYMSQWTALAQHHTGGHPAPPFYPQMRGTTAEDEVIQIRLGIEDARLLLQEAAFNNPSIPIEHVAWNLFCYYSQTVFVGLHGLKLVDRTKGILNPEHEHVCPQKRRQHTWWSFEGDNYCARDHEMVKQLRCLAAMTKEALFQLLHANIHGIVLSRKPEAFRVVSCFDCAQYAGQAPNSPLPSNNARIFIGGLSSITQRQIETLFQYFGKVVYTMAKPNGNGWVEFATRREAEVAISQMQSWPVGS